MACVSSRQIPGVKEQILKRIRGIKANKFVSTDAQISEQDTESSCHGILLDHEGARFEVPLVVGSC